MLPACRPDTKDSVNPDSVRAIYIPTTQYDGYSCAQLATEIQHTDAAIAEISGKLGKGDYDKSGGLIVTPFFLMYDNTTVLDETPKKAQELGRLKGTKMPLTEAAAKSQCSPQAAPNLPSGGSAPLAQAATKASTAEAMRAFGLVGVWPIDCANDKLSRTTYLVSQTEAPTVLETMTKPVPSTLQYRVESAVRITTEEIKITDYLTRYELDGRKVDWPTVSREFLFQRSGNKIMLINALSNGHPGFMRNGIEYKPTSMKDIDNSDTWVPMGPVQLLYEKCLN